MKLKCRVINELPFRGTSEEFDSLNCGFFMNMFKFLLLKR